MADLEQQLTKAAGDALDDGESFVAATRCEKEGGVKRRSWGAGLGGAIGMVTAMKTGGDPAHSIGGEALPHSLILGLTNRRLTAFKCSSMTGKPTNMIQSVPLAEVAGVDTDEGRVMGWKLAKFTVRFADGTALSVEAAATAAKRAQAFCEALERALSTAP